MKKHTRFQKETIFYDVKLASILLWRTMNLLGFGYSLITWPLVVLLFFLGLVHGNSVCVVVFFFSNECPLKVLRIHNKNNKTTDRGEVMTWLFWLYNNFCVLSMKKLAKNDTTVFQEAKLVIFHVCYSGYCIYCTILPVISINIIQDFGRTMC